MADQPSGFRELSRELAFIALYIYDTASTPINKLSDFQWYIEMLEFDDEDGYLIRVNKQHEKEVFNYAGQLLNGTVSNLVKIDEVINNHLVNWSFQRLHAADKALLRLSIYTLLYYFDMPAEVIIAEANDLANRYSDENTAHYVNGILHKVRQEYRRNFILDEIQLKENTALPVKKKIVLSRKNTRKKEP